VKVVAALAGIVLLAGCSAPPAADEPVRGTVTVLAAASLSGPLDQVAADFERAHPEVDVVISYGGSAALAEQIVSGAPADLFFSANESTMATVLDAGVAVDPEVVLTNVLEIAVPVGNPGGVTGLADFGDPELVLALCDPAVPCGSAAERLFAATGITPDVDTLEEDVKAALTKVELGEVDAALVYVTDVIAAGDAVEGIGVPEAADAVNRYPIAVLTDAPNPQAAQAFLDFVRSGQALKVFTDAGFGTP
jgi:molybdate transport system substrate-binding protein